MNKKQELENIVNRVERELEFLIKDITKLKIFLERDNYLEIVVSRIALLEDQIEGVK